MLALLFTGMFIHARQRQTSDMAQIAAMAKMVREVRLTDLCLFTEASYTRNPSQSDMQTPFQEHPVSLEHFPSGSLLPHQKERHVEIN